MSLTVELYDERGKYLDEFTLDTRVEKELRVLKKRLGIRLWSKFLLLLFEMGIESLDISPVAGAPYE